ncbi:MAG: TetR/AcrR family transcriptional regulator [Pseudomonadota bacterium]
MAKRTQSEKAESRENIVAAAATRIRENGIESTSIADVMRDAGMTHGGFYRHFESKEELVAAAITEAFKAGLHVFDEDLPGNAAQAGEYLAQYLSDQHVREPAIGCPIPLLGAEVGRGGAAWSDALARGVATASEKLEDGLDGLTRTEVLTLMSTLVGTLVIARGLGEGAFQREVVEASRAHVAPLLARANKV